MLRLSRLSDYGIVILAQMASRGSALSTTSSLSDRTGLPETTVSKVLKLLCAGGVLGSVRGVNGGYFLKETPDKTTVLGIISALEGPVTLTDCVNGHRDPCTAKHHCFLSGKWDRVNLLIVKTLESITLADMLEPGERTSTPSQTARSEAPL